MNAFKDQVAVVTGASSGIGRAIALGLAAEAATLGLVARHAERMADVADLASATSPRVVSYATDLGDPARLTALARTLGRDLEHVDILVHAAAIFTRGPVGAATAADLDEPYRVNLRAPFALTAALLPRLRPHRGQVVFVNSTVGLRAAAGVAAYAATKHGLRALADALREEVNPHGLRVLTVHVGRTATPMQAAVHALEGRAYRPERLLQPDDVAAVVIHALGLPRTAEVTDITIRPHLSP